LDGVLALSLGLELLRSGTRCTTSSSAGCWRRSTSPTSARSSRINTAAGAHRMALPSVRPSVRRPPPRPRRWRLCERPPVRCCCIARERARWPMRARPSAAIAMRQRARPKLSSRDAACRFRLLCTDSGCHTQPHGTASPSGRAHAAAHGGAATHKQAARSGAAPSRCSAARRGSARRSLENFAPNAPPRLLQDPPPPGSPASLPGLSPCKSL
jgi:hypothetical protein